MNVVGALLALPAAGRSAHERTLPDRGSALDAHDVVLVGTDFSSVAARALEEARRLAERLGARVEVLHVREGRPRGVEWLPDGDEAAWLEGVSVSPAHLVVRSGTAWVELARYAQERQAGLVVIGTHGSTGFQPLGLGGTAARLAVLSPRPVLLVGPRSWNGGQSSR